MLTISSSYNLSGFSTHVEVVAFWLAPMGILQVSALGVRHSGGKLQRFSHNRVLKNFFYNVRKRCPTVLRYGEAAACWTNFPSICRNRGQTQAKLAARTTVWPGPRFPVLPPNGGVKFRWCAKSFPGSPDTTRNFGRTFHCWNGASAGTSPAPMVGTYRL